MPTMIYAIIASIGLVGCTIADAQEGRSVVFRGDGPHSVAVDHISFSGFSRYIEARFKIEIVYIANTASASLEINDQVVVRAPLEESLSSLIDFTHASIGEMRTDRANAIVVLMRGRTPRPTCFENDDGRDDIVIYLYSNGDYDTYIVRKDNCNVENELVDSSYR